MAKSKLPKPISPKKQMEIEIQNLFIGYVKKHLDVDVVVEYKFHPTRKWRFDYAIPDRHIALEVEGGVYHGGRHTSIKGFLGDMEKYNTATTMGWRLVRTVPDKLITQGTIELLRALL